MALKLSPPPPLTIFSPQTPSPRTSTATEIRFSRWNNANAQKFIEKRRAQQEIEDDIRRERRFSSATRIADIPQTTSSSATVNENFRSTGTPSSPSAPSIPGRKSKYSKNPKPNSENTHPAFSKFKAPKFSVFKVPNDGPVGVNVGDSGVSYRVPNAPFEFQYSYTETPKVKPLALREAPFVPFGPSTMPRPWTGRAPLPSSKKKLPEFDSFRLPPPHKKGVKPVQSPGPFLAGMGPKYVKSREEILGDPLTEEEIKELIEGCLKTRRQLNMGRDGLTHNMLDNIHALWKRRRVCKIKCKGVCTVDMDNVRQQLEEKTGGKIIYSRGGVIFLFRGRNYNYRNRPRFPLMLWKPITPVYPRLIQQVPEGLTLEEATKMRKRGRELPPICKLGKNGVYTGLVGNVREAFEACELVRIDCTGMNGSDYKKIAGKLKDLVPCVLISFQYEHILLWRGKDWKSSLSAVKQISIDGGSGNPQSGADSTSVEHEDASRLLAPSSSNDDTVIGLPSENWSSSDSEGENFRENGESSSEAQASSATATPSTVMDTKESCTISDTEASGSDQSANLALVSTVDKCGTAHDIAESKDDESESTSMSTEREHSIGTDPPVDGVITHDDLQTSSENSQNLAKASVKSLKCAEEVIVLQKKAVESGSALVLDDESLDADIVYQKSVSFAKGAPPGPIFRNSVRKVLVRKVVKRASSNANSYAAEDKEVITVTQEKVEKKSFKNQKPKDFKDVYTDTLPYGSLGVDELAKLLG